MDITLKNLEDVLRAIGRGVVCYATRWDFDSTLALAHLGDTEGVIEPRIEAAHSALTLPEQTGPAEHERYFDGAQIGYTIPLFLADPALQAVVSPIGASGIGHSRQRQVTEYTLAIFPEQLFRKPGTNDFAALTYTTAAGWQVDGVDLTEAQEELLGMSVWLWRGSFGLHLPPFQHADGGKTVVPCEFDSMHHALAPEGQAILTRGDPADVDIDLDPA